MTDNTLQIHEVGQIKEIKKNIAKVVGLPSCMNGQLVDITANAKGMIMGFNQREILVLLLGKTEEVKVGDKVYNKMEPFKIPVGKEYLGRVVNALAQPLDTKGDIKPDQYNLVFRDAPSVLERVPITEALETGILIIDSTIPIGRGQRELIIGDRMTGKTTICIDTILNQKGKNVVCIYCCIGRSYASLERVVEILKEKGALDYTIVVCATAASSGGEQYLAPYTACSLGEYFMDNAEDVFVVFDDLVKHAWAYRQLSLLCERSPGRDAYPGDIFYLHSQLMERAGKLSPQAGGGSMTFFPIADTLQGDITGYIPSNLISMTDGQVYLNSALFSSGFRPSIDLSLSVSRIGSKVQCAAMKELSAMLRLEYIQYNELLKTARFKTTLSDEVKRRLSHGEAVTQVFIQDKNQPYPLEEQLILLYALSRGVLDILAKDEIDNFKMSISKFAIERFPAFIKKLSQEKELTPEVKKDLDECLAKFFKNSRLLA